MQKFEVEMLTFEEILAKVKSAFTNNQNLWGDYFLEDGCPKCRVEWKAIQGLSKTYYDCPKCGAKKEDYYE